MKNKKIQRRKKRMLILLPVITLLGIAVYVFLQQPQFGKLPSGERLNNLQKSPNYKDGVFQNLKETPSLNKDVGIGSIIWERLFEKNEKANPTYFCCI